MIAQRLVDIGFERPGAGVAAVEFGGFVEGIEGGAVMAVVDEGFGFVAPGHRAARVHNEGVAIGLDGSRVVAQVRTRVAQPVPGLKALWLVDQRLRIRGDGVFGHVHVELRVGFAIPGGHVAWIERQGAFKMHQRLWISLQTIQGQAGADPHDGIVRLDLGGFLVGIIGLAVVALAIQRGTFAVLGVKVTRVHSMRNASS